MLFGLFKNEMDIPFEFQEFPKFDGNVFRGPEIVETEKYIRATYYVRRLDNYENKLLSLGYIKKSSVRYDRNDLFNYIIIEKVGLLYKIAFHKTK